MEVSTEYDPDVVFYKNAIFSAFFSSPSRYPLDHDCPIFVDILK